MKRKINSLAVFLVATFISCYSANAASTKQELSADASKELAHLIRLNSSAAELSSKAKATLVFPSIVKAGLIFGGSYGEGVLKKDGVIDTYYNSISASWGLQAGAQSYGYVVFLMTDKALKYVNDSKGWEIGTGPTVAILDSGAAKNFSTTTAKDDAYAFIFDQQGLMASLSLEGTKITRIKNP